MAAYGNISPNSTVILMAGVPLDNKYENTLYFLGGTAQTNYFKGMAKKTYSAQSYQRVNSNKIRLYELADNIYDCDYLMFQNTNFGSKWFYAFILEIEYINNNVSEITYELDPIQTWWTVFSLDKCYVERSHTSTDALYGNLVKEDLDLGTGYLINSSDRYEFNRFNICVLATELPTAIQSYSTDNKFNLKKIGGVYSGLFVMTGLADDSTKAAKLWGYGDAITLDMTIQSIISWYLDEGKTDAIVSITMYPEDFDALVLDNALKYYIKQLDRPTSMFGYTPKNKKLLSYPYCYLQVTDRHGDGEMYKYENWVTLDNGSLRYLPPSFAVTGCFITTPAAATYPLNYDGKDLYSGINKMVVNDKFPQCSWVSDIYAAYVAQHRWQMGLNVLMGAGAAAVGGAAAGSVIPVAGTIAGAVGGAIGGAAKQIAGIMASKADMDNTPDRSYGTDRADSLLIGLQAVEFVYNSMCIRPEYAKIIDDYFTRYGYAIHDTIQPNLAARPQWTYIKTVGASVNGAIPASDKKRIAEIFDAGITVWRHPENVGNYSLDNSPS